MLSNQAINGYKDYTERTISYGTMKIGGQYKQVNITDKKRLADGRLAVYFTVDHSLTGGNAITEVRLYDTGGQLWLTKPENITIKSTQEGILYRFTFDFKEN